MTDDEQTAHLQRLNAYAIRIQDAVKEKGFDPQHILNELPPNYAIAALLLDVK